jgi:hypothetical protein
LPYYSLNPEKGAKVNIAIHNVSKYNPDAQLLELTSDRELSTAQILWADVIVFPFTTAPQRSLYDSIKKYKPSCKIIFCIDINFYEVPKEHRLKKIFTDNAIKDIEENIIFADYAMVNNLALQGYMTKKFLEEEQVGVEFMQLKDIIFIPFLVDTEIMIGQYSNIEYSPQKPNVVINKEIIKKVEEATKIKKGSKGKYNFRYKVGKGKKNLRKVKGKGEEVINKEVKNEYALEKPIRIGIIYTPNATSDISYYNDVYQKLNERYGKFVTLIMIGYSPENDKKNIMKGVNYEYVKPVSIIHYFKQLKYLGLDLLHIPLKQNMFNQTSENYNKYMEVGLFGIPVIVPDIFPYNKIVRDGIDGFIYKQRKDFLKVLHTAIVDSKKLKNIGISANSNILDNCNYTEANINNIIEVYGG